MRARPSRRADDGSHRFRTRDARVLRHGARRRSIADSSAVIPSALRARGGVRAVALGSRWAARGDAANPVGQPLRSGRSDSTRNGSTSASSRHSSRAGGSLRSPAPKPTHADSQPTRTWPSRHRHARLGQQRACGSRRRPPAATHPAKAKKKKGKGNDKHEQGKGQAPRARAAAGAAYDSAAGGRVRGDRR